MLTTSSARDLIVSTRVHPPPIRATRIPRTHILSRLNAAETKLTLLVGPAGYGKTTLLSQWARQRDEPVAWLSLSPEENVLPAFVSYLLAAIGEVDRDLVRAIQHRSATAEQADAKPVFAALLSELAVYTEPWTLVLDDYHVISNQQIDLWVGQLIDETPSEFRLVIASRTEPALRLARMHVRQELTRLDANDLRISTAELPELLALYGIEADASECLALNEHTHGWLAALHLAAIHASEYPLDRVIESLRDFGGDIHMLGDYLLQEVLDQQHFEMREFLLRSSILDRFTASTCRAVTRFRRAGELLDLAVRRNLFVALLDRDGGWYHYHHLFGDFLRRRLELEAQPGTIAALNQSASSWFEQHDLIGEAITYATRAGDWPRAATLISGVSTKLLVQQREGDLLAWLASFPPAVVRADPNLSSLSAYSLGRRGLVSETEDLLRAAEQLWRADNHTNGIAAIAFVRGALARFRDDDDAMIAHAVDSIALSTGEYALDSDGRLAAITPRLIRLDGTWLGSISQLLSYAHLAMGLRLRGRVEEASRLYGWIEDAFAAGGVAFSDTYYTPELGAIRFAQGRLHEAEALCRSFLEKGSRGLASERILACAVLGDVLREWNRLGESERVLREGIALAERFETPFFLPILYGALVRTLWSMGQTSAALATIDAMTDVSIRIQNVRQTHDAAAMRVRIALTAGQLEPARRWMATRGSDAAHDPDRATVAELMIVAQSLVAHGEAAQAVTLLGQISAAAERDGRALDLTQSEVMRSLAYADLGDLDRAMLALERAIELAEPEGYLRVFLDEGPAMRQLLVVAQRRGLSSEAIVRILVAADRDPGSAGPSADRRLHQPILGNLK